MMATEELSERERQVLSHVRKAQELGSTLTEYASSAGLDVRELYEGKRRLVRKGAIAGQVRAKQRRKRSPFAVARIVASAPPPSGAQITCRLVHPSGWVIECGSWPQASWTAAVLSGGADAAA
jgi:predicted transcriptional regulator